MVGIAIAISDELRCSARPAMCSRLNYTLIPPEPSLASRTIELTKGIAMKINIEMTKPSAQAVRRIAAVAAATIGVGAAAFFGGQSLRMNDDAVANAKTIAVSSAIAETKLEADEHLENVLERSRAAHKRETRKTVRDVRRRTRRAERRAADKREEEARSAGYSSGNSAGFSSGHAEGESEGYSEGLDDGAEPCSNDLDVPLPFCPGYGE